MIKVTFNKSTLGVPSKVLSALSNNSSSGAPRSSRRQVTAALSRLSELAPGQVERDLNATGFVRYLVADGDGLFSIPFSGEPLAYARTYLTQKETIAALGLEKATLVDGKVEKIAIGTRVEFQQVLAMSDQPQPVPVRGGFVHVFIDHAGHLIQVESSVRHGRVAKKIGKIISSDEAIALAKAVHGTDVCEVKRAQLVMSSHECKQHKPSKRQPALKMDPVYEILIQSCGIAPEETETSQAQGSVSSDKTTKGRLPSLKLYLVDGRTKQVINLGEKLRFSQHSKDQEVAQEPSCRYFPVTPDPKVTIGKQLIDYAVAGLPDPTKLQNQRFIMLVYKGGKWVVARAKADGTYNYNQTDPEFDAVIVFIALNEATALQEKWGLTKLSAPIPVYIRDRAVQDNAYFDPANMEIHIGVGSGVPNGLRKNIGWDKMVERHEFNGHGAVTLQTPGHDLEGEEGADMHESTGDTFALEFEYLDAVKFAKQLGRMFTVADVQKDPRIIGPYTMDGGIRVQRNNKRTPEDKTGEPHDDGLISGASTCDLLEAMIVKANDVEKGCENFGRLYLAALSLVPAHKVLFRDMLRAFVTADQTLNKAANRSLIEKAFGDHGIKLASDTKKKPRKPRKPKKGPGKKKSPGKKKGPGKKRSPKKTS